VDWVPESAQKRFHNFVEESPDWCISRQNYWGIPIPVWVCDDCGEYEVVGSFEQLEEKTGELPEDFDPHKHVVDNISWSCECGGEKERIPDIFDVWFDSGIAPFASLHYPFEEQPFEDMWPMDFITEGSDQIRGWFYSLMFTGILGFNEAPYEKVLFQGYTLDAEGEKMSKSLGNVVDPVNQLEEFGADLPRFYSLRVAAPWEQTKYDEDEIHNEIYRLFNVFWNTKNFLETHGKDLEVEHGDLKLEKEDEWVLSRLNNLKSEASEKMEECMFHELTREIEEFILEDVSRWYLKKVRSRIKNGDKAAIWALEQVVEETNKLLAPFTPYLSEKVYQELEQEKNSVHMENYPEPEEDRIDDSLEEKMDLVREIVEKTQKLRDEEQYNLRWPAKRLVLSSEKDLENMLQGLEHIVKEMSNVQEIEYGSVASSYVAEPDYSSLGPKFGGSADEVASKIEELSNSQIEQVKEIGEIEIDGFVVEESDIEVKSSTSEKVSGKSFSKGQIYLDTEMNKEIKEKSLINELIRAIQSKRKEEGLEVEDEVDLYVEDQDLVKEYSDEILERVKVRNFVDEEQENAGKAEFKETELGFSFSNPV